MAWTNAHHMFFRYNYLWSWLGRMHSICFADMITYDHGLDECTAYVLQIWLLMIMAWTNAQHMFCRYNYLWSWLGPMHIICFSDIITYDHGLDQMHMITYVLDQCRYDYLWSWLGLDQCTSYVFQIWLLMIMAWTNAHAYVFQIWLLMIMAWTNAHHMFCRYNYLWSWHWTNAQHMFFRYDMIMAWTNAQHMYLWSWLGPMHSICFADIITYDHGLDQCTSYVFQI